MNLCEIPSQISQKDFDLDDFVQLALDDPQARAEIVRLMMAHPDIMVYYHCFYVAAQASQDRPDLFYPYRAELAALLDHPNSYHRNFGLTLLANLTPVDRDGYFAGLLPAYLAHLNDSKFMTACCCAQNLKIVVRSRPELRGPILSAVLEIDRRSDYPPRQKALLKFDVLEILELMDGEQADLQPVKAFIQAETGSLSPKTRKKAREMARQFGDAPAHIQV